MSAKRQHPSTEGELDEGDSDECGAQPLRKAPKRGTTITLVASDGGTLEVEACHLWGASNILRDAWAFTHPTPTQIVFDDTEIETSLILDLFVAYIEGRPVALPTRSKLPLFQGLLRFTDKWGCLAVQRHVLSDLSCRVLSKRDHDTKSLFEIAAIYDHARLAKTLISRSHQTIGEQPSWSELQKEVTGRDALDLRTWEIEDLAKIPLRYRWALERATLDINWKAKDTDWVKVANRFQTFLQIAKK